MKQTKTSYVVALLLSGEGDKYSFAQHNADPVDALRAATRAATNAKEMWRARGYACWLVPVDPDDDDFEPDVWVKGEGCEGYYVIHLNALNHAWRGLQPSPNHNHTEIGEVEAAIVDIREVATALEKGLKRLTYTDTGAVDFESEHILDRMRTTASELVGFSQDTESAIDDFKRDDVYIACVTSPDKPGIDDLVATGNRARAAVLSLANATTDRRSPMRTQHLTELWLVRGDDRTSPVALRNDGGEGFYYQFHLGERLITAKSLDEMLGVCHE